MDERHDEAVLSSLLQELDRTATPPPSAPVLPLVAVPQLDYQGDELIEVSPAFDLNGFQVVRREFFAHLHEPSITFNAGKFGVNSACLSRFPDTEYVEVMVNPNTKILALRPCSGYERDSFRWCTTPKGKRTPRQISCKIFSAMVLNLMGWSHKNRYKVLGRLIQANGQYLIAFDLNAAEVYLSTSADGEKPRNSRTPVFPEEWEGQFGMPFNEHQNYLQISVFDGYAVYSISDKGKKKSYEGPDIEPPQEVGEETIVGGTFP